MVDGPNGCLVRALPEVRQWKVTGEVVYINHAHRWYRVRYFLPNVDRPQHECFHLKTAPDPAMPYIHGYRHERHKYPPRLPQGEGLPAAAVK